MSCPGLLARSTLLALLLIGVAARAESRETPKLALAAPPPAPRTPALVKTPHAAEEGDGATPARSAPPTNWWPWALIAVAAAGVGALVFISSGGDPACPGGRTCK